MPICLDLLFIEQFSHPLVDIHLANIDDAKARPPAQAIIILEPVYAALSRPQTIGPSFGIQAERMIIHENASPSRRKHPADLVHPPHHISLQWRGHTGEDIGEPLIDEWESE